METISVVTRVSLVAAALPAVLSYGLAPRANSAIAKVNIAIGVDGVYMMSGLPVSLSVLKRQLTAIREIGAIELHVVAPNHPVKEIGSLISAAHEAGIRRIGFTTESLLVHRQHDESSRIKTQ